MKLSKMLIPARLTWDCQFSLTFIYSFNIEVKTAVYWVIQIGQMINDAYLITLIGQLKDSNHSRKLYSNKSRIHGL